MHGAWKLSSSSSSDAPESEFATDNHIVCLYKEVRKVKSRYKVKMLGGIMRLHGRDYVFGTCKADFMW